MLTPPQVLEHDYLVSRHQILEIAAMMDRYDAALERAGSGGQGDAKQLAILRKALAIAADPKPAQDRTVALLELFATA